MEVKSHAKKVLTNNHDALTGEWLGIYNKFMKLAGFSASR